MAAYPSSRLWHEIKHGRPGDCLYIRHVGHDFGDEDGILSQRWTCHGPCAVNDTHRLTCVRHYTHTSQLTSRSESRWEPWGFVWGTQL